MVEPAHLQTAGKEKKYWLNKLAGELVKSYFPYERIKSITPGAGKMVVEIGVPNHLFMKLNHIASQSDKNLYVILLSALTVLMGKYTGNNDILLTAPIYKQRVQGEFINTVLVIRNRFRDTQTIKELLVQVKQTLAESNQNLNYPLDRLLYHLGLKVSHSREFALSETAVLLENIHDRKYLDHLDFNMLFSFSKNLHTLNAAVEYNPQLYRRETVERIAGHFILLLEESVKDINTPIVDILLLSERERQLLVEFNETRRKYPWDKTLHELFEDQVQKIPDKIAVVAHRLGMKHSSPGTLCSAITYRQLNERSNQLARLLRAKGIGPGAVVGIMAVPTMEMIIGILAVLKAGGTYLALEPQSPKNRLKYMLTDSDTRILLTLSSIHPLLGQANSKGNSCFTGEIIIIDTPGVYAGETSNLTCICGPGDNVYAIYTSGTTGNPKGVLVKHENMVNYVSWFSTKAGLTNKDKTFLTSSFIFDLGYTNIFTSILNGGELHLGARQTYLDPEVFLDSVQSHEITYLKMTPALFNVMVNSPGFTASRCRSLKLVVLGGEAINITDIKRLQTLCSHIGVMDEYGPTETTIGSIAVCIDWDGFDQYLETPTIGRPIANTRVLILDNHLNPVPIGVRGEIYISGTGVATGYLNNPELTSQKFQTNNAPFEQISNAFGEGMAPPTSKKKKATITYPITPIPHCPIYMTGDLARWLPGGNIEFLGRIDNQVKIRGHRIETGEIESRLLDHEGIKEAAVLTHTNDSGNKFLCAYIVPINNTDMVIDTSALKEFLSHSLPEYMTPQYVVRMEKLPLTPNGKLNRKALPLPGASDSREYAAPRNKVEEKLVKIWSQVLNPMEKKSGKIGINDSFFELGGNSLSAVTMVSKIHKDLNVKVPLEEIFKTPTIVGLSAVIAELLKHEPKDTFSSIDPVEKKEYYPLSSAQKRMFTLQQLDTGGTAYNVTQVNPLPDRFAPGKLAAVCKKLIKRHESLRTSFHMVDRQVVQKIHDDVEFSVDYVEVTGRAEVNKIINDFIKPFDLSRAPLLRIGVLKILPTDHLLLADQHHIVSDGISLALLVRDFTALYNDEALPPLRIQYKSFSQWQNSEKQKDYAQKQETYWLNLFKNPFPVLQLPTDFPRPPVRSFAGGMIRFQVPQPRTQELKILASKEKVSLYMVLLALFSILLAKLSGQENIVIGTPIAGRRHANLEKIIGMFVNTLAIRNYPNGNKSINRFLAEIKESTLQAFENQDYQFEDLVEQVSVNRDPSHNPIFDVVFSFFEPDTDPGKPAQINTPPQSGTGTYGEILQTAKFDLTLMGRESDGCLLFAVEYCTKLFKSETIQRLVSYFKKILDFVLENPGSKLSEIEILTGEQKKEILNTLDNKEARYPGGKLLHELFEQQVKQTPDIIALVADPDNELHEERTRRLAPLLAPVSITYRELHQKSHQLAHQLIKKGVKPDNIVGIMVERQPQMIMGILAILKAGGAYLPIDPEYPEERINYMLADSGTNVLVTTLALSRKIKFAKEIIYLPGAINRAPTHIPTPAPAPVHAACSLQLAYVLYTSGTPGEPKGVMIEHRNVVRLMFNDRFQFDFNENDVWTMFHSYCFDFSVWEMFGALLYGGKLVVIPKPVARDTEIYRDILKREKVTVLNQTPSAFYNLSHLELKHPKRELTIKYIIFGGEALNPIKLKEWKERYPGTKLINMFGITETTVHVTFKEIETPDLHSHRSNIGKPIPTLSIMIMNTHRKLQPVGVPGELYVGGAGIGRGYLDQPGLTHDKFVRNPFNPKERLYRSGDLVKLNHKGDVEYLGRIDNQVKIRGHRIELGEIQAQLLTHHKVKEAIVMEQKKTKRDKYICAYIVPRPLPEAARETPLDEVELRDYLSRKLPVYMIPTHFIPIEYIPLTANGKVDKKALSNREIKTKGTYIAPRDQLENQLTRIWGEVLDIQENVIGITDNFFELGGHSLNATIMTAKIHQDLQVKLPLAKVFEYPDIISLARYIKEASRERFQSLQPVEKRDYYPLSSAQKRLYLLQQMELESITYNLPQTIVLPKQADSETLERIFLQLIERHESLRTSFHLIDNTPVQRIHDHTQVKFEIEKKEKGTDKNLAFIKHFIRPFDLSRAPLLRVGLIKYPHTTSLTGHLLLVDMHHIITDGISQDILIIEFSDLYAGKELPGLRLQYKDFSEWQNSEGQTDSIKQQEAYWLNLFPGDIPVLALPLDFPRPAIQAFEGDSMAFELPVEQTGILKRLAKKEGVTLYMMLLAVFNIFLSKITGQEDIIVGTPIAARRHADMARIIGMFVNTLVFRNHPSAEKSFKQFLAEIKKHTLDAFENQEYPFEELVDKVSPQRDISRNPLFDVMFSYQNLDADLGYSTVTETGQLEKEEQRHIPQMSKFDLTLFGMETGEKLGFKFQYCTKLFKAGTIKRLSGYFKHLLTAVSGNVTTRLSQIEITPEDEKKRVLYDFNDTRQDFPGEKTLHQLFSEQAERTPGHIAVIGPETKAQSTDSTGGTGGLAPLSGLMFITYKKLHRKSNQLAHLLKEKGVQPDTIVGIMVERSIEMIIGIMGILKAGGAYLPIDLEYPKERIEYIRKNSGAKIVLTGSDLSSWLLFAPKASKIRPKGSTSFEIWNLGFGISPWQGGQLAYVIYTSGSTGRPKGVMIEHGSLVNRLNWMQRCYPIGPGDVILQKTTFTFDVSVWELFWWSLQGASLCLLEPGGEKNPEAIVEACKKSKVTVMHFVPSMLSVFLEYLEISGSSDKLTDLAWVFASGEALELRQVQRFNRLLYHRNRTRLANLYGPTEAAVDVSYFNCSPGESLEKIPIGKPIDNTRLYIVNKEFRPQPVGVVGELCIGGVGLARGYLNRPELTAEKFFDKALSSLLLALRRIERAKNALRGCNQPRAFWETPGARSQEPGVKLYKTGDLAKWLPDGNIEFLGRIDYQVKLRGYRIELGEIESQLLLHPDAREAVVLAKGEGPDNRYLCAYIVSSKEWEVEEIKKYLSQSLPDYMIPSYFVEIDRMPLAPNGKIDRKALPGPAVKGEGEYTAPRGRIEEKLAVMWRDVLGVHAPIGIDDHFFKLGGHSLKAVVLKIKIHKELDVDVPLAEVFKKPTIRALAQYIAAAKKSIYEEIKPGEKRDYYLQSSAQKRLFFLDHFEDIGTSYNMPSVLKVTGNLEKEAFENAFKALILRHEILRTSFHLLDNQPVQRVHHPAALTFEIERRESAKEIIIIEDFIRPFDLAKAPLLRAGIVEVSPGEFLLLFDMHHIVGDGTSRGVLVDDFTRLYAGESRPFLKIQYKEFSHWQNMLFKTGKIREQEEYWLNLYSEKIPRLNLPGDYPRPPVFRFNGHRYGFGLEVEEAEKFKALNPGINATLFMKLLAVFNILLHKYTGQEDIVIGSGIAGRRHSDLDNLIGMFVNTLAMRNFPAGEKTWPEWLDEVENACLNAFEHQDLQFEELVDKLEPERDPSRSPIFDVSLMVQNFEQSKKEMKGVTVSPYGFQHETSKFDMTLFAVEQDNGIHFSLEYCTALFKEDTIRRFSNHFLNITRYINRTPNTRLADIDILTTGEKQQLLFDFNETEAGYPKEKTIHELFSEQVVRTPHQIAVVLNHESLTYGLLEESANQLANYLHFEKSTRPGEPVGILMDREIELVIALLGILKAGGAYVPLDPGLPKNRIKSMIHDGQIGVVVARKKYIKTLNRLQWECFCFHTFICMDSFDIHEEEEQEKSGLMDQKLWEYVGETAENDITGGGWVSSYTGEPFSREEMDEYGDNILKKLTPLVHPRMRVLEIGCASGISMYRIAPQVGVYHGTDLSSVIIRKNREQVKEGGYQNIQLECLAAHEIDRLRGRVFDLVIINSVIQAFHGHNYLRQVIAKSVDLMEKKGYLFIGDVMDLDLKEALIRELVEFKTANLDKNYTTKTQFSEELFVSREFFEDLAIEIPSIRDMEFSRKIYTIQNELTKFRYDVLLTIDKACKPGRPLKKKHKYQHDLTLLRKYGTNQVTSGVRPENPAYVIYTSGTTGVPRGVMVEHKSLVNYISWRIKAYEFRSSDAALQMISPAFDGFAANLYPGLLTGGRVILADTEKVLDYYYINKVIREERVTNFSIVPSMYQVILEGADRYGDDLKSIRFVVLAGERTGRKLLQKSMERYPGVLHINEYGPTETTVAAVSNTNMVEENIDIIGTPISNTRIYLLFMYTSLEIVPVGVPGEMCIAGCGVSRGYLNNPELTAEKFRRAVFSSSKFFPNDQWPMTNDCLYKTGDRARWLVDGSIEFLGRIDQQVKIRGYRIELGEIETRLSTRPGVKEACVIDRDETGDKYICAYIVPHTGHTDEVDVSELEEALAAELPDYMIPSYFVQLEKIPLTPNGKVDRKALSPPAAQKTREKFTAPRDETEEKLAGIWAEVLGVKKGDIGIDHDFFQLGGHSLRVIAQSAKIHKEFNVNVPIADMFKLTTIRQLSQYIKGTGEEKFASIDAVEKKEYYPLSSAQKRLYLVQQMDLDTTAYHTPEILMLEKEPDGEKLEETFKKLIQRHETLRTSFEIVGEEPFQRIHERAVVKIERPAAADKDNFVRPFDLSRAPLLRVGLMKDGSRYMLIIDMHHIITDGTSQRVLKEEFMALYTGEKLPPLKLQYKDYSRWQSRQIKSMAMIRQEEYWLREFEENIPVFNLPTDYERTAPRSYEGDMVAFTVNREEIGALKEMAQKNEATLYMVLLALYNIFLSKICLQEDILVGTPIAGRRHADLERSIGMFVNVIALKNNPKGSKTFEEFLAEVKEKTLKAFENQDYPYDLLVERFGSSRDLSRNPLVETHFVWQESGGREGDKNTDNGETVAESFEIQKTKLDITLTAAETGGEIRCQLHYVTRLFKRSTINKFCRYFVNILETTVRKPEIKLDEIELVAEEDKDRMVALNRQNKKIFSRFKAEDFNEDF